MTVITLTYIFWKQHKLGQKVHVLQIMFSMLTRKKLLKKVTRIDKVFSFMRIDCADISLVRFVIGRSSAAIALSTIAATAL